MPAPIETIGEVANKVAEYALGLDPSPKMILHEPYREVWNRICLEFEKELRDYEKDHPSPDFVITKEAFEDDLHGVA